MDESKIMPKAGERSSKKAGLGHEPDHQIEGRDPRVEAYERLVQQLDHSPLGTIEWGPDFRISRWSTRAREIFGWREEEVLDKHFNAFAFVHPEEKSRVEAGAIQLRHSDVSYTIRQNRNLRKDGSTIHCEWYNSVIRDERGKLCSVLSLVYEVTVREEAKQRARESEQKLNRALDAARMGTWDWDLVSGKRTFDERTARALGYGESATGTSQEFTEDWIHPQDLPSVRAAQAEHLSGGASSYSVECRLRTRKEGWRWFLDSGQVVLRDSDGRPMRSSGTLLDVTERRSLEEVMRQGQKMQALGTLAGGVAHEFNNILLAIFGYVELAVSELPAQQPAREYLSEVMVAARRAEALVEQILAFGRNGGTKEEPVDLIHLVERVRRNKEISAFPLVSVQVHAAAGELLVSGDGRLLERMLNNLLCNARESLTERNGTILIELDPVHADRVPALGVPGMKAGRYVRLAIRDTGCGMDPDRLQRACEPFFTTKQVGTATGLGLAVVHGIVRAHGGCLKLESQVGVGTLVEIFLPVLGRQGQLPKVLASSIQEEDESGAHILVVDDEEALAVLSGRLLSRAGFRVSVCTSSQEALALLGGIDRFDLLLTDQTMPYGDGYELARRAREIQPDLPVVLVSGNALRSDTNTDAGHVTAVLSKPFGADELSRTIRRALGHGPLQRQRQ